MEKIILHPKVSCKICGGLGTVYDSVPVPFGHGYCSMPSYCECSYEDISEELQEKIDNNEVEIKIIPLIEE